MMSKNPIEEVRLAAEGVYPELVDALVANLAVVCINSFSDYTQPVSLINVANSGAGKTTVLDLILPDRKENELFTHRSDNFTPASFVSHAANVAREKLKEVDLLPQVENKAFIVKELAPLVRGSKEDLTRMFAILTTVLDGKGLTTNSGVHGKRGYERPIVFSFLGASTPFPYSVFALMSQLGGRLLFWNMDSTEKPLEEMARYVLWDGQEDAHSGLKKVVNDFIQAHFTAYSVRSYSSRQITIGELEAFLIAGYARVLVKMRSKFRITEFSDVKRHAEPVSESEYRVIQMLRYIARSLALIHGRKDVDLTDLHFIRHITLGSMAEQRRKIFGALLEVGGEATTSELLDRIPMSKQTLLEYTEEISHLGICDFDKGGHADAGLLVLRSDYRFLLSGNEDAVFPKTGVVRESF